MAVGTLYVEELKATMRGRFAWLGAGVMLLAVGCVATVGTQDTWLDGYGIITYFLVPLAFIPLAGVFLANPRYHQYLEYVLIAPLFMGQTIVAPAATGMGVLLAYAGFVPLQELLVAQGNGATRTGHLTPASPAVLLKNAFAFTLAVGSIPAPTTRTWIAAALV